MTKAWCIWCEDGIIYPKNGYCWIHPQCFDEIASIARNIEQVGKYLRGELPRIKGNGELLGYKTVEEFLVSMADFDKRSKHVMELFKQMRANEEPPRAPAPDSAESPVGEKPHFIGRLPDIRGEDAKRFIEDNKKPLTAREKKSLDDAVRVFRSIKPREEEKPSSSTESEEKED